MCRHLDSLIDAHAATGFPRFTDVRKEQAEERLDSLPCRAILQGSVHVPGTFLPIEVERTDEQFVLAAKCGVQATLAQSGCAQEISH
ncbi:hypothetical protein D3C71_1695110 [compost metagenome]